MWTIEEIDYLESNYSHKSNRDISKTINKSEKAILNKAGRLNLHKSIDYVPIPVYNHVSISKKIISGDIVCKVCESFGTNSMKGMSIHLTKKHSDIDHREYYLENIGSITNCHFCGCDGKFIDIVNGFRNLCDKDSCISKSRNTESPEFLVYKYGMSLDEATSKYGELKNSRIDTYKKTVNNLVLDNPNFNKERSINSIEYWLKRGYTDKEATENSAKAVKNMQNVSHKLRKDNPEDYDHCFNNKIEYYLNKGMSFDDSIKALKDRQTTFSLNICIDKHGRDKGIKIFNDRTKKWQKSLMDNGNIKCGYSAISQELFNGIISICGDSDRIYFATKSKEFFLSTKECFYQYDFTDRDRMKMIEYHGDLYHGNPEMFGEDDYPHPYYKENGPTAREMWDRDKKKVDIAIESGFQVLTIWDTEYKSNKYKTIQKCIGFLLNK